MVLLTAWPNFGVSQNLSSAKICLSIYTGYKSIDFGRFLAYGTNLNELIELNNLSRNFLLSDLVLPSDRLESTLSHLVNSLIFYKRILDLRHTNIISPQEKEKINHIISENNFNAMLSFSKQDLKENARFKHFFSEYSN